MRRRCHPSDGEPRDRTWTKKSNLWVGARPSFLQSSPTAPLPPEDVNVESDAAWTPVRMEEKVERHDAGAPLAQH